MSSECFRNCYRRNTIRYDTVDIRALKSWRDGQLNLAHGPETKNNEKIKIKNRVAKKKRCRQKSAEAVREEEVKLRGIGFVKEVGFKPAVKERWSYRCTKWWIRRGRSDGWRNRWAGDGGIGARMRFTKRQRKCWWWCVAKFCYLSGRQMTVASNMVGGLRKPATLFCTITKPHAYSWPKTG